MKYYSLQRLKKLPFVLVLALLFVTGKAQNVDAGIVHITGGFAFVRLNLTNSIVGCCTVTNMVVNIYDSRNQWVIGFSTQPFSSGVNFFDVNLATNETYRVDYTTGYVSKSYSFNTSKNIGSTMCDLQWIGADPAPAPTFSNITRTGATLNTRMPALSAPTAGSRTATLRYLARSLGYRDWGLIGTTTTTSLSGYVASYPAPPVVLNGALPNMEFEFCTIVTLTVNQPAVLCYPSGYFVAPYGNYSFTSPITRVRTAPRMAAPNDPVLTVDSLLLAGDKKVEIINKSPIITPSDTELDFTSHLKQITMANKTTDLVVYPNPVASTLNIQDKFEANTLIHIVDGEGKVVKQVVPLASPEKQLIRVDVSKLPAGIYFVNHLSFGKVVKTAKIVKK